MSVIDRAIQSGSAALADRRSGQRSLFDQLDSEEEETIPCTLPDIPEWDERERLLMEKEVLGFYLSSHPLAEHQRTLATYCSHTTADLGALPDRTEVILGGMLSAVKTAHVRRVRDPNSPTKYVNFDLEDMAGTVRSIMWPDEYVHYGPMVQPDAILVLRGTIDRRGGGDEVNVVVSELIGLDQLDSRYTRGVIIRVDQKHAEDKLPRLREIVRGYPGDCELQLMLQLADGSRVYLKSCNLRIEINPEMRNRIDDLLGPGNFRLLTAAPTPRERPRRGSARRTKSGVG
jgi:DNA polymerase-3 subunit alpha